MAGFIYYLVVILQLLLSTLAHPQHSLSYTYDIEFISDDIVTPCAEFPNNFVDIWMDWKIINKTLLEDGEIFVSGPVIAIKEFPKNAIPKLNANTYKKIGSDWTSTSFFLIRDNLCKSVFSPMEMWHKYLKSIDEDKRICPPSLGLLDNIFIKDFIDIKSPLRNADGTYKVHATIEYGQESDQFICFEVLFNAYRK